MKRRTPASPLHSSSEPLLRQAYRAAGHLLMDYLLRRGVAAKYVPMDRSLMLPERTSITLNGAGTNWGESTTAVGSWLTVPQVLLAGYAAERLQFGQGDLTLQAGSPVVDKALHLLKAYLDHYRGEDDLSARDAHAQENLVNMHAYAARFVRRHWAVVDVVAEALLRQRTLDRRAADELVRRALLRRGPLGLLRLGLEGLGRRLRG